MACLDTIKRSVKQLWPAYLLISLLTLVGWYLIVTAAPEVALFYCLVVFPILMSVVFAVIWLIIT